ncbi:hypothetical protein EM6_3276 (plasmid) [Asticcacaulis excentricus]|uniref:Uncharacterized protein n=1 Tax=Asticcacaulis excentricus TaxID=78587 RepID=A0A3G9G9F6_9CAUL|nr:hypothetical protein EM6_3276 [Asticcacaulis excentricus]
MDCFKEFDVRGLPTFYKMFYYLYSKVIGLFLIEPYFNHAISIKKIADADDIRRH